MKVVVIGGSGLIGTRLVTSLRRSVHEVIAASPSAGVNTITGEGLAETLAGAAVVVDVANSPVFEDRAVLEFFEKSSRNLLAAEAIAGVKHHIALSIVGADRLLDSGYLRAKLAQENLVRTSRIPYTIVRSTQFFEFLGVLAQTDADARTVHLSAALFQPVAADDVAAVLADVALATPVNGIIEVAGPERVRMSDLVQRFLNAKCDGRNVVAEAHARYFGAELNDRSLVPGNTARVAATRFDDWLVKGR